MDKDHNKNTRGEPDSGGSTSREPVDFIRAIVARDRETGKHGGKVHTRFPPEPNGFLHIGHAKAICLDFDIAVENDGVYNLRFDDTNPTKEESKFAHAIMEDIKWLGYDWEDRLFHASDYFERLYEYAVRLVEMGRAYVCNLSADEIREYRGTLTEPGKDSPWRNRSIEENLDLFRRMREGEFEDGSCTLRAKIDMASGNLNMRDPVIYRVMHTTHHRSGDKWCIYPMYDFTHCLSDSMEGITHSLCDISFEDHRPLYDWFLDVLETPCHPQQIEFARLNLSHTITSKRKLRQLVEQGHVTGWDDPRMPTLSAMRRRGYTPESIRSFCSRIGVAKRESIVDMALLEFIVREDLNKRVPRAMGVLRPLKVVIENYPEGQVEELDAINSPEDPSLGSRKVPFSRTLYIEQDDFREEPPPKFYRLAPGREVRLRYAYFIKCVDVVKDASGDVIELRCTYDPETRGGSAPDNRKVKATLHWVSAERAIKAEARLYEPLFTVEDPTEGEDPTAFLNPNSLEVLPGCFLEPSLASAKPGARFQLERLGYFCIDAVDSAPEMLVLNRTVTLKDAWARIEKKRTS